MRQRWLIFGASEAVVLLGLGAWCATRGSYLVWGPVSEWVGGLGTVGTLAISLLINRTAVQDRALQAAENRRRQATQVFGAVEQIRVVGRSSTYAPPWPEEGWEKSQSYTEIEYRVRIVNASPYPVTDLELVSAVEPAAAVLYRPPRIQDRRNVLLPGEGHERLLTVGIAADLAQPAGVMEHSVHLTFSFVDAAGHHWQRDDRQRLVELH